MNKFKFVNKIFVIFVCTIVISQVLTSYMIECCSVANIYIASLILIGLSLPISLFIGHYFFPVFEMAKMDKLTGIYSRDNIDVLFENSKDSSMVIFLFNVSNFTSINEKYGYKKGDEILKVIASGLEASVRNKDFVVRWGGDEFIVVCMVSDHVDLLIERVNNNVDNIVGQIDVPLKLNMGISQFPEDGDHFNQLVQVANDRLYVNKNKSTPV